MDILKLVPEEQESSFDAYIDNGIERITHNKEFCGLTISKFVDWLYDQDMSHRMICGIIRNIMVIDFAPQMSGHKLIELETYQMHFKELLERFIKANWKVVLKGFNEDRKQQFETNLITQFEQIQISKHY
ncbi:hypothetical protein CTH30272_02135 [Allocatenococcus thiocycli]|nr:hypothetical protein CTH30272_02135 [Catenococcus thiocycli]